MYLQEYPVADPGFPIGGGGGTDLRCGHFSVKTCVKTKELDPVGGGGGRGTCWWRTPLDPPMVSLRKNKKAVRLMAQLIKFYKFYYLLYLNKRWLNSQ